jgi:hypothetical protein
MGTVGLRPIAASASIAEIFGLTSECLNALAGRNL